MKHSPARVRRIRSLAVLVGVAVCVWGSTSRAHQVDHEVSRAEAIVIELHYADGTPFAYEECEVRAVGADVPLLVGRTDAEGRLAFVPPTAGRYAARALSEDGHGASFEFDAAAATLVAGGAPARRAGRGMTQMFTGVVLILGLFFGLRILARSRLQEEDR